mmetsp:Transcript_6685/g.24087  ORF Transcript_6685/g.24087 Transcript_6685/m.24087 type:complete len:143 (-) Transcript_6685:3979-4407(-)
MGSAEITVADVKSMKVAGLREELGKRGLDTSGLKAALQERLEKALEAETLSKELEPLEEPAVAEEKAWTELSREPETWPRNLSDPSPMPLATPRGLPLAAASHGNKTSSLAPSVMPCAMPTGLKRRPRDPSSLGAFAIPSAA